MSRSHPYPIPEEALRAFCVPGRVMNPLCHPWRGDGEVIAGNGYAVIRVQRGRWLDRDFPAVTAEVMERIGKIPWSRFVKLRDEDWHPLGNLMGCIWFRGELGFWQDTKPRPAPTPIWRVGDVLVRLSALQMIAKLPRVEVAWTGGDPASPLWFRFSGGRGAIAFDKTLRVGSYAILQPRMDDLSGELVKPGYRSETKLRLVQPGTNWPPVDLTE